ncbi:CHAD domain-containing protein [Streptomyces sp. VRA16 Mangrove soil]|uniref:CHAD domain-containing protein n=1 Tax=Streptomyces sp. VRA16 Mangrove soil TaxID=2817434 RepID=UPI001A9FFD8B|nr:CHAD domain-containing protein [Streptomyces sp. VRA16 Mangrove soil]MBO1337529.1 CHAD domain-containing protein [Streptomyces sp. VRA16 Mangrove soil]
MAQQHLESSEPLETDPRTGPGGPEGSDVLGAYLQEQATEFLRSLRRHGESGPAGPVADAARALRRAARRISGTLHTFRPLLDPEWSDALRPELAWLSGTLAQEHACTDRLARLNEALHRLTSPAGGVARLPQQAAATTTLALGAAKAAALLDRQLTLARTRAHSTALQALGSPRFHAVADRVAVLASEVPLTGTDIGLAKLAGEAGSRLAEAVAALHHTGPHPQGHHQQYSQYDTNTDAPWHHVRLLLRLHRYAQEVVPGGDLDPVRLSAAAHALNTHRDAAEAAAAAAQAARTPRIAPATAYALGVLHADQRHQVEAARNAFRKAWQRETVGTP